MSIEFLGKTVSGPFTIPSGIVTTAPSIIQRVMDEIPEIGVITTKSIGPVPRAGNREPAVRTRLLRECRWADQPGRR